MQKRLRELAENPLADKSDSGSGLNSSASEGTISRLFRSKRQQNVNQTILRLEGVNDRTAASYYFGKRVVYVYKTTSGEKDKRFRVTF